MFQRLGGSRGSHEWGGYRDTDICPCKHQAPVNRFDSWLTYFSDAPLTTPT